MFICFLANWQCRKETIKTNDPKGGWCIQHVWEIVLQNIFKYGFCICHCGLRLMKSLLHYILKAIPVLIRNFWTFSGKLLLWVKYLTFRTWKLFHFIAVSAISLALDSLPKGTAAGKSSSHWKRINSVIELISKASNSEIL